MNKWTSTYGETKPGIFTSEFLLTLLVNIAVLCAALADALPARWAAVASAVSIAGYALGRGHAKEGVAPNAQTDVAIKEVQAKSRK